MHQKAIKKEQEQINSKTGLVQSFGMDKYILFLQSNVSKFAKKI